jgi:hypothetical protein
MKFNTRFFYFHNNFEYDVSIEDSRWETLILDFFEYNVT